ERERAAQRRAPAGPAALLVGEAPGEEQTAHLADGPGGREEAVERARDLRVEDTVVRHPGHELERVRTGEREPEGGDEQGGEAEPRHAVPMDRLSGCRATRSAIVCATRSGVCMGRRRFSRAPPGGGSLDAIARLKETGWFSSVRLCVAPGEYPCFHGSDALPALRRGRSRC